MPFFKFEKKSVSNDIALSESTDDLLGSKEGLVSSNPKEIPLILLPGLFGNGGVCKELADQLHAQNPKRPIFIFYNACVINKNVKPSTKNLQQEIKAMAKELQFLPKELYPNLHIAGHSFGCILGAALAQLLQSRGQEVNLFMIDNPSVECMQEFLNRSTCPVSDILNIINYAAKLALLAPIQLTEEQLSDFEKLSTLDCFDKILASVLEFPENKSKKTNIDTFQSFLSIAKHGLTNIINYDKSLSSTLPNINAIKILMTKETAEKYNNPQGGWQSYSKNISMVEHTSLELTNHHELLNEKNAAILAAVIEDFLDKEMRAKNLKIAKASQAIIDAIESSGVENANILEQIAECLKQRTYNNPKNEIKDVVKVVSEALKSASKRISPSSSSMDIPSIEKSPTLKEKQTNNEMQNTFQGEDDFDFEIIGDIPEEENTPPLPKDPKEEKTPRLERNSSSRFFPKVSSSDKKRASVNTTESKPSNLAKTNPSEFFPRAPLGRNNDQIPDTTNPSPRNLTVKVVN
ncbi:MAG: hypothetical protein JO149_00760 [Gammaproteobacteria bacterium]|nr:hypothetical protein [Gammaproteobacteria bacterium]